MSIDETQQTITTRDGRSSSWRDFFLRMHFYAGILVGPFLLIAAITGGLYAIAPTLEQWLYRDQLHVNSTGPALPITTQVGAAQRVRPDLTVVAVRPAVDPGDTTRVMFSDPHLGPSERHAVFIDPATLASAGESTVYGSSGALPLRTWISDLHRSLHLGEPGRLYSELAASWLWLIVLGGLFLWLNRFRRSRDLRVARLLTIDRSARGRRRVLNWHGAVGMWIAVGLIFLSATGLTWSAHAGTNITDLRAALAWETPAVSTALSERGDTTAHQADHHAEASGGAGTPRVDDLDRVLASAREAGIDGKVEASIPAGADTAFTVAQTREPWRMSNNAVAVDGATGVVTDRSWFADWPLAAKLSAWGIQVHMGTLFGLPNQLALVAVAVALVTVIVRGYLMWWHRRPVRGGAKVGRPPRRGALTRVPPGAAVLVVALAAMIGYFIPLLGLSLVAFVAADAAAGALTSRRAR